MMILSFCFISKNFKHIKSGNESNIPKGYEILYEEYKNNNKIFCLFQLFFMVRQRHNNLDEENGLLCCSNYSYKLSILSMLSLYLFNLYDDLIPSNFSSLQNSNFQCNCFNKWNVIACMRIFFYILDWS